MNTTIIIFSGFNQRAVIAFIRTLVNNSIDFSIIALSNSDPIFLSDYKQNVGAIRKTLQLDLTDILRCIDIIKKSKKTRQLMIAPSTEALNRFLLKNRNQFEQNGCIIPLVNEDLYKQISDKEAFCNLCRLHSIKVPSNVKFDKKNIPFVIKPKYYESPNSNNPLSNPIIVNSDSIFERISFDSDNYFCQEYISGKSYYYLFYISKNKSIIKLTQENILQQPQGKSIVAARLINNLPNYEPFSNLFISIGFYGLVMVEVRIVKDETFMIEANPRFWGPSQLFVDSGINLFEAFLKDNGISTKQNQVTKTGCLYYWEYGMSPEVICHNNVDLDISTYKKHEIYNRPDTTGIYKHELILKLISFYQQISKHSQYQILPNLLTPYIKSDMLIIKSRAEQERFKFITENVTLQNKKLIDIGANTGYFSFESITAGVSKIMAYEGNSAHASFINTAIELLNLNNKMTIRGEYYSFTESEKFDVCYLLNVLHHIGDDYQQSTQSKEKAKEQIIRQLNIMATQCKTLVFQMGFNWKGNINECLFNKGTKSEMISFITDNTKDFWRIKRIGIAEDINGSIIYKNLNNNNIKRNDKLGEFLNRPLFIMESKIYE